MTTSKTYTIETRLNQRSSAEIIEYVREYNVLYGRMLRFTWHRYKNGGTFNIKKSDFNTILKRIFGVSKRHANSVISEIEGLCKALYQIKWHEYEQLKGKIAKKRKKIENLSQKVFAIREKAKENGCTNFSLWYYYDSPKIFTLSHVCLRSISLTRCVGAPGGWGKNGEHFRRTVISQAKDRYFLRSSKNQPHGTEKEEPAERDSRQEFAYLLWLKETVAVASGAGENLNPTGVSYT